MECYEEIPFDYNTVAYQQENSFFKLCTLIMYITRGKNLGHMNQSVINNTHAVLGSDCNKFYFL